MDFFSTVAFVVAATQAHWVSIAAVVTFFTGAGLTALRQKAYKQFAVLALQVAATVAKQELSDEAKRHAVVDGAYDLAPTWVQKLVTKKAAEQIADNAFAALP